MKKKKKNISLMAWTYIILRILVVLCMMRQMYQGNVGNSLLCVLTLILFSLPDLIEEKLNIEFPNALEITILVFIYSSEILGEINEFYIHISNWDTILHTINGFIMAGIGYSLVDLLSKNENIKVSLSPIFISIFAFCFSMTIGIFWEFFEYTVDNTLGKDMQKDTIVTTINSVTLNKNNKNEVISIPINSLIVNGEDWKELYGGYIDIGLHDTMKDLFVNFIGALSFSVIGFFYTIDKSKFAKHFIPQKRKKA